MTADPKHTYGYLSHLARHVPYDPLITVPQGDAMPPDPTLVLDGQRYTCPGLSAGALSSKLHGPGPGAIDFDPVTTTWTLHGGDQTAWERVLGAPLIPVYAVPTTPAPNLAEQLAAQEHDRWARWMIHLFSKGTHNPDGTWTMPAWAVERWQRQATTSYAELSEIEKDSDRAEAARTLAQVRAHSVEVPG